MKKEIEIFKNKKIRIILKKREKPIPELEQLAKAMDEFKKEIQTALNRLYDLGLAPFYGYYEAILNVFKKK